MKVANRIALGYLILILLPVILLAVQVFGLRRLKEAGQRNSGENLVTALTVVDLIRDRDAVEVALSRFLAQGDPASSEEMKESLQSLEGALREIRGYRGSDKPLAEIGRLDQFWREFSEAWAAQVQTLQGKPATGGVPPDVTGQLDRLRAQSITVYQAILRDMRNQAADARKSSERIEMVSWWIGGATLVFGGLAFILIIRSISLPLRNLSEGTRAIAEGKAFYRLDTSRNDEFSQIARDFNILADRIREKSGAEGRGEARQL